MSQQRPQMLRKFLDWQNLPFTASHALTIIGEVELQVKAGLKVKLHLRTGLIAQLKTLLSASNI